MPVMVKISDSDVFPTFHLVGTDAPCRGSTRQTVAERPFHRDLTHGVTLSRALWRQPAFREDVRAVRSSSDPRGRAWSIAKAYGRGQRRRSLIANLMISAALVPEPHSRQMLEWVWMRPIIDREGTPLRAYRRVTSKTVADARRGADLIARRGAGLCIVPGCEDKRTSTVGRGTVRDYEMTIVYCARHADDDSRYADEKDIERAFGAAIEAWPSTDERRLLHWYLSQRERTTR